MAAEFGFDSEIPDVARKGLEDRPSDREYQQALSDVTKVMLETELTKFDIGMGILGFSRIENVRASEPSKSENGKILRTYVTSSPKKLRLEIRGEDFRNEGFHFDLIGPDGIKKTQYLPVPLALESFGAWMTTHMNPAEDLASLQQLHDFNVNTRMPEVVDQLAPTLKKLKFNRIDTSQKPDQFAASFERNADGDIPKLLIDIYYRRDRLFFMINSEPHNPLWHIDKEIAGLPGDLLKELPDELKVLFEAHEKRKKTEKK